MAHQDYQNCRSFSAIAILFVSVASFVVIQGCANHKEESGSSENENSRLHLTFGQRQLEQLLADRPDMNDVIPKSHSVSLWVASSFNGDQFGSRVYWVADSPRGGFASEFTAPIQGIPAMIRLTAGTELTPIDKWASLIFEFHNLLQSDQFTVASERAFKGELSGDEYARECVRLEYLAGRKTADFFRENSLPIEDSRGNKIYAEILLTEDSFEEYVKRHESSGEPLDNFDYFKKYYDDVIAPGMIPPGN